MKIAMFADRLELGGVESHIVSLVNGLLERGHEVLLSTAAAAAELITQIQSQNGVFYETTWSSNPEDDLNGFEPDIIHAHPFTAIIRGYQLATTFHKPFFVTIHGLYNYGVDKSALGYSVGEKAEAIIAVDAGVAAFLRRCASFPEKVVEIYNGIDLRIFKPLPLDCMERSCLGLNQNWFTMVVISRLGDGKEIPIIEIVKYLPKWGLQLKGANLLIVGDGPGMNRLQEAIESIHSPGLHYHAIAVGRQIDITRYLSAADLVLACDRAALEAMACQRPVLAMNAAGFAGLIDKNNYQPVLFYRNGYQPLPEAKLTQIILTVAKKIKFRSKIALHSCSIIQRYFDINKSVAKLEMLYQKAIGVRG